MTFRPTWDQWGQRPNKPRSAAQEYQLSMDDWMSVRRLVDGFLAARATGKNLSAAEVVLNETWRKIGDKMGFNWKSARECPGKSSRWVLAFPKEVFQQGRPGL